MGLVYFDASSGQRNALHLSGIFSAVVLRARREASSLACLARRAEGVRVASLRRASRGICQARETDGGIAVV